MMNPMSIIIASSDPRIAFTTSPAGPSLWMMLETDSITQSKAGFRLIVRTILLGYISSDVLMLSKLVAQSSAIGVSGEAADLVDLRKVFAADGVEDVAGEPAVEGKSQFCPAGGHPIWKVSRKHSA